MSVPRAHIHVRLHIIYNGHNACLMHDHVTVISFTLITIVAHQNLSTSVTLTSFIQPRAVVCMLIQLF